MVDYPQMPPLTTDELESFLSQPLIAKICSHNDDGSIHIAPLFFKYDDGEILLGTQHISHKIRNLEHNPDVTVLIDTVDQPFKGVIIYGTASLDYDKVVEKRTKIFENYMPPENAAGFAQGLANKWEGVVIRVKPNRIISYDYGKAALV
jgi:general stress protein 26